MITGTIRVNDNLTLMNWEAVNCGRNPFDITEVMYSVTISGIDSSHRPYYDEFEVYKPATEPMPYLVILIMTVAMERESHTKRPVID